jgi:hypothetical protein
MDEDETQKRYTAAAHYAATRYAADRVWDLQERHPDLTVSQLIAILEKDAYEALSEVAPDDAPTPS